MDNESMRIEKFCGNELLVGILENLYVLVEEQNAAITYDELPKLYGNPVQIMRLIQNLIINSIKYRSPDVTPLIHVSIKDEDTHWRLSIQDNGVGIKNEFSEQIFQPFRRLHSWNEVQGSGLGLSICRKIVTSHGGEIAVVKNLEQGTIITFTLLKGPLTTNETIINPS